MKIVEIVDLGLHNSLVVTDLYEKVIVIKNTKLINKTYLKTKPHFNSNFIEIKCTENLQKMSPIYIY